MNITKMKYIYTHINRFFFSQQPFSGQVAQSSKMLLGWPGPPSALLLPQFVESLAPLQIFLQWVECTIAKSKPWTWSCIFQTPHCFVMQTCSPRFQKTQVYTSVETPSTLSVHWECLPSPETRLKPHCGLHVWDEPNWSNPGWKKLWGRRHIQSWKHLNVSLFQ